MRSVWFCVNGLACLRKTPKVVQYRNRSARSGVGGCSDKWRSHMAYRRVRDVAIAISKCLETRHTMKSFCISRLRRMRSLALGMAMALRTTSVVTSRSKRARFDILADIRPSTPSRAYLERGWRKEGTGVLCLELGRWGWEWGM